MSTPFQSGRIGAINSLLGIQLIHDYHVARPRNLGAWQLGAWKYGEVGNGVLYMAQSVLFAIRFEVRAEMELDVLHHSDSETPSFRIDFCHARQP